MTASETPSGVDRGRIAAGVFAITVLLVLAGLLLSYLLRPDPNGSAAQPLPTPAPTAAEPAPADPEPATPTETTPDPTTSPTAAPEPTELPTGDLEPGTTAIFHGQPATGPWQTIGSIREITADGAGPVAAGDYQEFWAAHGLPDELWDTLVARVSLQAVELGPPLERPVLNGAAGSEVYNARGGLHWTNEETRGRGHLVAFDAIYDDNGLARWPRWAFLVDPQTHEVLAELPRVEVSEDEVETVDQATDRLLDQIWELVLDEPVITDG